MRETTYAVQERRGAKASVWPLSFIAAVFVLPTYSSCSEGLVSPAAYASRDWYSSSWVVPVFACAAVLALLTARALRRGEVDLGTRRLGLVAVTAFAMATVGFAISVAARHSFEWPWLAAATVATTLAAVLVRQARGMSPWRIWERLLAAYVLIATVTGPTVLLGGDAIKLRFSNFGPGAYLYLASLLALCGILASTLVRARPRLVLVRSSD